MPAGEASSPPPAAAPGSDGTVPATGMSWTGISWTGISWTGISWTGISWTGISRTRAQAPTNRIHLHRYEIQISTPTVAANVP